jgi:DNA-binding NarL/FixJ family response regulator
MIVRGEPGADDDHLLRAALRGAAAAADRSTWSIKVDERAVLERLAAGLLSVVEQFELDGRRLLVVRRAKTDSANLTVRQREVATLVAKGCANKWIAMHLGVSEQTVATHLARAMVKVGVTSRMDLIRAIAHVPGAAAA